MAVPVLKPPFTPELLWAAQAAVATTFPCRVLEFGSGWSTLWFQEHGCDVISFEHDPLWAKAVLQAGFKGHVHLGPPDTWPNLLGALEADFDVCYVDCKDEYRVAMMLQGMRLLRQGGLLVLDDTHWQSWKAIPAWPATIIYGHHLRHDGETHFHHTTLLRKP
jgi:predicted O-methyltransferase YrrM